MGLLFLIPILVCGFFFLSKSHFHKHKFQKLDGQQLYLKSAFFGFLFTAMALLFTAWLIQSERYIIFEKFVLKDLKENLSICIINSIYGIEINKENNIYKNIEIYKNVSFYIFFTITFINSILITALGVELYKFYFFFKEYLKITEFSLKVIASVKAFFLSIIKIFPKFHMFSDKILLIYKAHSKGLDSVKKEIKDPLNNLLYSSILINNDEINGGENSKFLLITMNDRKVYIGNILGFGMGEDRFSLTSETFIFLPFQSGYRDKYDKLVKITTSYIDVINKTDDINEITIVLRRDNILSAVKFDEKRFIDISAKKDNLSLQQKQGYKIISSKFSILKLNEEKFTDISAKRNNPSLQQKKNYKIISSKFSTFKLNEK
ncbi:hypothetical protein ACXOED_02295 [Salmonella enterica]